jgi:hypothetical protein
MLKSLNEDGRRVLPNRVPAGHLGEQTRKPIFREGKPDRRLYEIATLAALRDCLRAGDAWVESSRAYRPIDEHLMPQPAFASLKDADDLGLGVQRDGAVYLAEIGQILDFNLKRLTYRARNGKLQGVRLVAGKRLSQPCRRPFAQTGTDHSGQHAQARLAARVGAHKPHRHLFLGRAT